MMNRFSYSLKSSFVAAFSAVLILAASVVSPVDASDIGSTGTFSGKGGKENGKENFVMYCIYCHGEEGKGNGPIAESLGEGIYPRDLTDASILSERTDAELFKVIKEGGPAAGFDEAMPAQGGAMLTDEEVKNIILYIRADFCKCDYKGK